MPTPAGLPPIFENTPVDLVPHQLIAEFPANTFLESIVIAPDIAVPKLIRTRSDENGVRIRFSKPT
jgi:hypothetical protein